MAVAAVRSEVMISPHAIIDPKAEIAADVEIGPLCVIGPNVRIESGSRLISSVTVMGHVLIGRDNVFYPNCVIGGPPQDRKYRGAPTRIEIGTNNIFRESCTVHVGTERGGAVTRVGGNNMFMVNVHLAHDVQVGSNCTLANNVMVAGHVIVGDNVAMMGGVGVHQLVTIGKFCFLGGYARIHHDAPPFLKIDGSDEIRGVNAVGLRRAGFGEADIEALSEACRLLFNRTERASFATALAQFDTMNGINPHVKQMVEFLRQRDLGKHGRYLQAMLSRR